MPDLPSPAPIGMGLLSRLHMASMSPAAAARSIARRDVPLASCLIRAVGRCGPVRIFDADAEADRWL